MLFCKISKTNSSQIKSEDLKLVSYHEGRPVNSGWLINALEAKVNFLQKMKYIWYLCVPINVSHSALKVYTVNEYLFLKKCIYFQLDPPDQSNSWDFKRKSANFSKVIFLEVRRLSFRSNSLILALCASQTLYYFKDKSKMVSTFTEVNIPTNTIQKHNTIVKILC